MTQEKTQEKEQTSQEWINEILLQHTPMWALFIAEISQRRGLTWLQWIHPVLRYFTDLEVKTDTNMKSGHGFSPGRTIEQQHIRVFKRGRMIAEKKFKPQLIKNSPYSKL